MFILLYTGNLHGVSPSFPFGTICLRFFFHVLGSTNFVLAFKFFLRFTEENVVFLLEARFFYLFSCFFYVFQHHRNTFCLRSHKPNPPFEICTKVVLIC